MKISNGMKKIIVSSVVVLIAVVSVIWWQRMKRTEQLDSGITIGAIMPITGQVAILGEHMRNGMELAKQDLISEGVVKNLDIIYKDACDGASSLAAVRELLEVNKVKVIGSSFCLLGIDAISPITEANKVILFNTAANPESVLNKKYLFSTNITIGNDSEKMAEYAYEILGAKTVAIIHLDTSFGKSYRDNVTNKFESLGGKVVYTKAEGLDVIDFKDELGQIKIKNPDMLMIIHFGNSLGYAVKQARELGIKSVIMGDYESEDSTLIRLAREATEGMIISSSEPKIKTKNVTDFKKRYQEQFGELPDVLASNAYDALRLQVATYIACKGDTDCMAGELLKIKNYDGVSGLITVNKDHSVEKPTIFKIIKAGKFIEIK